MSAPSHENGSDIATVFVGAPPSAAHCPNDIVDDRRIGDLTERDARCAAAVRTRTGPIRTGVRPPPPLIPATTLASTRAEFTCSSRKPTALSPTSLPEIPWTLFLLSSTSAVPLARTPTAVQADKPLSELSNATKLASFSEPIPDHGANHGRWQYGESGPLARGSGTMGTLEPGRRGTVFRSRRVTLVKAV